MHVSSAAIKKFVNFWHNAKDPRPTYLGVDPMSAYHIISVSD